MFYKVLSIAIIVYYIFVLCVIAYIKVSDFGIEAFCFNIKEVLKSIIRAVIGFFRRIVNRLAVWSNREKGRTELNAERGSYYNINILEHSLEDDLEDSLTNDNGFDDDILLVFPS